MALAMEISYVVSDQFKSYEGSTNNAVHGGHDDQTLVVRLMDQNGKDHSDTSRKCESEDGSDCGRCGHAKSVLLVWRGVALVAVGLDWP